MDNSQKILEEIQALKALVNQALPKRFVSVKEYAKIKGIKPDTIYKDPEKYGFQRSQGRWEIEYSKI